MNLVSQKKQMKEIYILKLSLYFVLQKSYLSIKNKRKNRMDTGTQAQISCHLLSLIWTALENYLWWTQPPLLFSNTDWEVVHTALSPCFWNFAQKLIFFRNTHFFHIHTIFPLQYFFFLFKNLYFRNKPYQTIGYKSLLQVALTKSGRITNIHLNIILFTYHLCSL